MKFEARDFYDFENGQFLYLEDLFSQMRLYAERILGDTKQWPKYPMKIDIMEFFWGSKDNMDNLVRTVKKRITHQKIDFNLRELNDLSVFRKNLRGNLLKYDMYISFRDKSFFQKYIKSIKFVPAFQKFGFSQYYLYFRPFYYNSPDFETDFRLLLVNSFQKIKYPASIEPDIPLFFEYIFPFRTPNTSYLNWLVKSKQNVAEYCLFYKKKFYDIFHFNRNITKNGWDYSAYRFRSYIQNILFNPTYDPKFLKVSEFDLNEISDSHVCNPDMDEYEKLTQIYNTSPHNIKKDIWSRNKIRHSQILELLEKKLIFPYLNVNNLDFQDKVSIILPNIYQEITETLIKIFAYFNVCRIYEIEGEFYIYNFDNEKPFEKGLLIEIWFPKCEMDEFFDVFDLLFQYLEINHYIILTDLVDGKTLLKSVYGNLEFLKDYNPLLNLKWNDKDKIWMNHKLFNEKFEPIYPDLISKEN